jgi:hypothetical protein
MACPNRTLTAGIDYDCTNSNAAIGSDKTLQIVQHSFIKLAETLPGDTSNTEQDNTNGNEGGLTKVFLDTGGTAATYDFVGTDYSVMPFANQEIKEDGDSWWVHGVTFTAYSKDSKTRNILEELTATRVVAIVTDRSTGLKEIFGLEVGLKAVSIEREYLGTQNSNFYKVTLQTEDIGVIREAGIPKLTHDVSE